MSNNFHTKNVRLWIDFSQENIQCKHDYRRKRDFEFIVCFTGILIEVNECKSNRIENLLHLEHFLDKAKKKTIWTLVRPKLDANN